MRGGGGLCMCGRAGGLLLSARGKHHGRPGGPGAAARGTDATRAAAQNHPNWRVVVVGSDNCLDTVYYGNQRNMMITNWHVTLPPPARCGPAAPAITCSRRILSGLRFGMVGACRAPHRSGPDPLVGRRHVHMLSA